MAKLSYAKGNIRYFERNLVNSTVCWHCSVTNQLRASVTTMKEKYLFTRSSCIGVDPCCYSHRPINVSISSEVSECSELIISLNLYRGRSHPQNSYVANTDLPNPSISSFNKVLGSSNKSFCYVGSPLETFQGFVLDKLSSTQRLYIYAQNLKVFHKFTCENCHILGTESILTLIYSRREN